MLNRFLGIFLIIGIALLGISLFFKGPKASEEENPPGSSAPVTKESFWKSSGLSALSSQIWEDLTSGSKTPEPSVSAPETRDPTEIFRAGYDAYERRDYEGAIREYDLYLKTVPSDVSALYNRGLAKYSIGRFSEAETDFTSALEIKPDNADVLLYRGYCRTELENRKEAFADVDRAIKLGAKYPEAYVNRAILYNLSERPAAALKDANEAVRLDQKSSRANFQIGYAYYSLKKYNESISAYTKAIELNPRDGGQTYYNRGLGFLAVRKKSQACDDFKRSLEIGYSNAEGMIRENCK
ncbi:tetratricopeptide repeat protein [Leptospira fluminis]|uniref:Tetratricopeptide repeat protein n=1 Tax=Leptospira fluminis TaxID=2484979 RepID=A0A4R9GP49_9LEPT|nr:tetratricopeptide repeat protein [Leptospira fluminis]TGK18721.1 tetratricopeptide repeat protein [Leptospira fluminis]